MKRYSNLMDKICDMENLYYAFYKAKKGKNSKLDVYKFGNNLKYELNELYNQLKSGDVYLGDYKYFTIYDPKERIICAAPFSQRVLHHSLMNVCHEYFEKRQIYDSYASRKEKGTYKAIQRAKYYCKKYKWYLKIDFKKYFDSLSHDVLKNQLNDIFKDKKLLDIFNRIIDSYNLESGKGVPIGNLTSQYFANNYLCEYDHYIKEVLKIKGYVRYMDDCVFWENDKDKLIKVFNIIKAYSKFKLKLELKPECLNKTSHGLPFLGYLIYPDNVRLAKRSKKRFIKKIVKYKNLLDENLWNQKQHQEHLNPLLSFTMHSNSREFRKNIMKRYFIDGL